MGNQQSSGDQNPASGGQDGQPRDYYELLEISEEATSDEIRRSYRRLALVNHPDKNPDRVEEATKIFTELQLAYEILMDPNERAWYDSHRNTPLPAGEDDLFDHVRTAERANDPKVKPQKASAADPGIRIDQLMRFFDPKLARKLDDSKQGFFSTYRSLFALLDADEKSHAEHPSPDKWPSFGDSETLYAPPVGLDKETRRSRTWVKDFYTFWSQFTTGKRFDWVRKWNPERGEDRGMRRLMDRENKRVRDEYRKEYNETVRHLVSFLRNRDPRVKSHRAAKEREARHKHRSATDDRESQSSRSAQQATESRHEQRIRDAEAFEEQEWQRISEDRSDEDTDEEAEMNQTLECIACNKTFASRASWENHERSKKHKQAIYRLKKQMEAEDLILETNDEVIGLSEPENDISASTTPEDVEIQEKSSQTSANVNDVSISNAVNELNITQRATEEEAGNGEQATDDTNLTHASLSPIESQQTSPKAQTAQQTHISSSNGPVNTDNVSNVDLDRRSRVTESEAAATTSSKDEFQASRKQRRRKQPLDASGKRHTAAPSTKEPEVDIAAQVANVRLKGEKIRSKWSDKWQTIVETIRPVAGENAHLLCLGLGVVRSDRVAQYQLALLSMICKDLDITSIAAYDPVWQESDHEILRHFDIKVLKENKAGQYQLEEDRNYILYMPHCPKSLYEAILISNFSKRLCNQGRVLLGNQLSDYTMSLGDAQENASAETGGFSKPKKKRKGRQGQNGGPRRDGVLERLAPHLSSISLSSLPDTHLPGFARATLSLSFQYLAQDKEAVVDWAKPLPPVDATDTELVV